MSRNSKEKMKSVELNSGFKMPIIGLGMWQTESQEEVEKAMETAIDAGYRHFDTATIYENEELMGSVLQKFFKNGKIKRGEIFIVSKVPPNGLRPDSLDFFLNKSLKALQLDYLDLYLIHFPIPTKRVNDSDAYPVENDELAIDWSVKLEDTWKAMESLVEKGLVRSIGLSNFNSSQVQRIYDVAKIKPSNLQVECHAYLPQFELVNFCKELNITVTAFSPLGTPGLIQYVKRKYNFDVSQEILLKDPKLQHLAAKHSRTPAQILLRYLIEREIIVIPKSSNPKRIKENIEIFDFELDKEDLVVLLSMSKNYRYFHFSQHKNMLTHPEYPFNTPF